NRLPARADDADPGRALREVLRLSHHADPPRRRLDGRDGGRQRPQRLPEHLLGDVDQRLQSPGRHPAGPALGVGSPPPPADTPAATDPKAPACPRSQPQGSLGACGCFSLLWRWRFWGPAAAKAPERNPAQKFLKTARPGKNSPKA